MSIKRISKISFQEAGFSLIELAIVLFIVALLLGGLLVPLTAQIDQQRTKDTQKTLAELKEALIGFAIGNNRLPCPATPTSTSGQESFCRVALVAGVCPPISTTPVYTAGRCSNPFDGLVPAAALGMTPVNAQGLLLDGWNNPIRYAVSNAPVNGQADAVTTINGMKLATITSLSAANMLYVCSSSVGLGSPATDCGAPTPPTILLTNNTPALVFSLGKNGNAGTLGPDETANINTAPSDPVFVSHEQSSGGAGNEDFDDMFAWIPTGILISRMVSAGQLP